MLDLFYPFPFLFQQEDNLFWHYTQNDIYDVKNGCRVVIMQEDLVSISNFSSHPRWWKRIQSLSFIKKLSHLIGEHVKRSCQQHWLFTSIRLYSSPIVLDAEHVKNCLFMLLFHVAWLGKFGNRLISYFPLKTCVIICLRRLWSRLIVNEARISWNRF